MKTIASALALALSVITPALVAENHEHKEPDCPMSSEHSKSVDERGDEGMGFSHEKTTHHFILAKDGGIIDVAANNASDTTSRDQIRMHLAHIAKLFSEGNFEIPMFVHSQMPAGAAVMQEKKDKIGYSYEETEKGGRIRISTNDPAALRAVHDFLRFQITEHRTGDPMDVRN